MGTVDIFGSIADASVRNAAPLDASAMGQAQVRSWRSTFEAAGFAPDLAALDPEQITSAWREAITDPPSSQHRVFVACAGPAVVGFAAVAPALFSPDSHEADAIEIIALIVDPPHQRAGHGSRLLAACVDMSADEAPTHITTWILDGDAAREQFFREAGLVPDGVARELEIGSAGVAERRWSAQLDSTAVGATAGL